MRSCVYVYFPLQVPNASLTAIKVKPTGFSSLPPVGPAIPVTETPISAPAARQTPSAIRRAIGSLTAP